MDSMGDTLHLACVPLPQFQTPGTETQKEAEFRPPLKTPQALELGSRRPAASTQTGKVR